ncbi:hypothetical protein V2W50_20635, partial [Acinetobacter baumannii]|uniref:hypothetical protein n=1 Tax=Acinetobacter baumannii TaxID=470 RepID=UPI00312C7745
FWGERVYTQFIEPAFTPAQAAATRASTAPASIPPRPANAIGGRAFIESIADLPPKAREAAIVQEITRGNVPDFLRQFAQVRVQTER